MSQVSAATSAGGGIPPREYETIYVLRPDASRETTEGLASRLKDVVGGLGTMRRIENWGRRRLAYDVAKHKRGVYVYIKYSGVGNIVSEVERTLRLQESVLKFQTVKLGEIKDDGGVKAEDLEFHHVEPAEDERDESYAQTLGLEGRLDRFMSSHYDTEADDEEEAEAEFGRDEEKP
ncbi:MAG TPA: 30S ribosomal protein S6 [Polyangiaceae bacterium]|nr:30S ribosomal protein S6 [Polyangiaceae bacterium]